MNWRLMKHSLACMKWVTQKQQYCWLSYMTSCWGWTFQSTSSEDTAMMVLHLCLEHDKVWVILQEHCTHIAMDMPWTWLVLMQSEVAKPWRIPWIQHMTDQKVTSMRYNIAASQGRTSRIIPRHSCTLPHKMDCSSASITNYHQKLPSPPSTLARVTTFCHR